MNSKIMKLTAAAVIVIAALVVINQFKGSVDVSSVALGQVAKNMETIHSYTCRMTSLQNPHDGDVGETKQIAMLYWYSDQYGFKMEQYTNGELSLIVCMLSESNEGMRVWPKDKKYRRMQLTAEDIAIMKSQDMDPREWVNLFMAADYKTLRKDLIDGDMVEGVEINQLGVVRKSKVQSSIEDYAARIWIDIGSKLPVRLEEEYIYNSVQYRGSAEQFQWNVEITPADLEPDVPDDYMRL